MWRHWEWKQAAWFLNPCFLSAILHGTCGGWQKAMSMQKAEIKGCSFWRSRLIVWGENGSNAPNPLPEEASPHSGAAGAGISGQTPGGMETCPVLTCWLKGNAGWAERGSPSPQKQLFLAQVGCYLTTLQPHFETGEGRKTEDNMAPHKTLRAEQAQWIFRRGGDMVFILEHQLILFRSALLDLAEQMFHVSCAAGATPSTIWAEAQTYIPAHSGWKAQGEKSFPASRW